MEKSRGEASLDGKLGRRSRADGRGEEQPEPAKEVGVQIAPAAVQSECMCRRDPEDSWSVPGACGLVFIRFHGLDGKFVGEVV